MLKEGNGKGASEGQIWPCGRLFNFKKISSSFIPGFLLKERIFSEGDFRRRFPLAASLPEASHIFFAFFIEWTRRFHGEGETK
ncbi:MAG: hypothetical protein C6P37_07845 [Caldibacillus debilis]|uniref:Uncharacterized protein n=1 Tax=Caldibacillus debilis TaxID=301148 RepID=A0A3E0K532_9BACI|nr:MAG: hypothetical protein C6P37_07845 [Caldibacillus debilis]